MKIPIQKSTFSWLMMMVLKIMKTVRARMIFLQNDGNETDLKFVKKFTRPNCWTKEFYTLKTRKLRQFLPAINSKNASFSFGPLLVKIEQNV